MTDSSRHDAPASCLGRTCLKWAADGELTPRDRRLVFERLAQVDQELTALRQATACAPRH